MQAVKYPDTSRTKRIIGTAQAKNELRQKAIANNPKALLTVEMLTSLKSFTKVMFKQQYKREFIIAPHHEAIIEALQDVVDGKCKRLIINIAPRYGKTELVIKSFISWCFALNPRCKFLHLSYSDMLVNDNSDTIRSIMLDPLYKDLFPQSALESEKGSSKRWKTKAGGELYAVSTQGQVTGFGAGLVDSSLDDTLREADSLLENDLLAMDPSIIDRLTLKSLQAFSGAIVIDDPIKPEDAESELIRERINLRFENTIRNRVNSRNTPIIIIMQRLHEHDLCGYLQSIEPDEWRVLSIPVIQEDPNTHEQIALWPMKHTLEELLKIREINPVVFDTQYMQNPTPREGLMYAEGFSTYSQSELEAIPQLARLNVKNYTDTADTGSDALCSICFIDTPDKIYIVDVLFTTESMEVTEKQTARMLARNHVLDALIESNNGGRGFARNVKRLLRTDFHNFKCAVNTFTQTQNKASRIFTNSACVMNDIVFPVDWEQRWPKFYQAITSYRKDNKRKSQHDDAPDALTGVYEMHSRKNRRKGVKRRN